MRASTPSSLGSIKEEAGDDESIAISDLDKEHRARSKLAEVEKAIAAPGGKFKVRGLEIGASARLRDIYRREDEELHERNMKAVA
eukprot:2224894-Pyramimonas_sp.AAC.1